ncbi:MAG: hypothetical protein EOO09_05715 [Chitinophagaceae bacterium]|nr:MAG: hypothetical protein EOO09_05715 [Chitinophagaceae bacterium]
MKLNLLIGATLVLGLGSCSTAYRSGQTPDDLYYSPGRSQDEYVQVKEKDDRAYNNNYENGDDYYEDRYLRMRVANRYQWGVLDDYYFNNPYAYNYYGGAFMGSAWNNPWNSYFLWNNFYNPYAFNPGFYHGGGGYYGGGFYGGGGYYGGGFGGHVVNTRVRTPSRPISFNPASYSNGNTRSNNNARNYSRSYINNNNGSRYSNSNGSNSNSGRYNNGYNGSNSGRNNSNSGYQPSNNNNNTPSRSYNPPPSTGGSSSGGSSSSGSTGGGTTRPPR